MYAKKAASRDEVMRALAAYDNWYVPAVMLPAELAGQVHEHAVVFGTETNLPPGRIWIFTDVEAANVAAAATKVAMGLYIGGISGTDVLGSFDERFLSVEVNAASPRELTWFFEREAFPLAALWASAIGLERALALGVERPDTIYRLSVFAGFTILLNADRSPVLVTLKNLPGRYAVVFTAPDRAAGFLANLPPKQREAVTTAVLDGPSLFAHAAEIGAEGVVFNIDDPPATTMVPKEMFGSIR